MIKQNYFKKIIQIFEEFLSDALRHKERIYAINNLKKKKYKIRLKFLT